MAEVTKPPGARPGSRWRWAAATGVVGIGLVIAITGVLQSCQENALVTEGNVKIVEVCKNAPSTDPRYAIWLLLAVALVWQDISEVTFGSVSIKRRLEQAERDQQGMRTDIAGLQQLVQLSANQTTVIRNEPTYVNLTDPNLQAQLADAGVSVSHDPEAQASTVEEVGFRLLRVYQRVSLFDERYTRIPDSISVVGQEGDRRFSADRWFTDVASWWPEAIGLGAGMLAEQALVFTHNFPDTLDGLRAVRNAVAHGRSVEEQDLREAYNLGLGLEEYLLGLFSHWRSLDDGTVDIGPRLQPPTETSQ